MFKKLFRIAGTTALVVSLAFCLSGCSSVSFQSAPEYTTTVPSVAPANLTAESAVDVVKEFGAWLETDHALPILKNPNTNPIETLVGEKDYKGIENEGFLVGFFNYLDKADDARLNEMLEKTTLKDGEHLFYYGPDFSAKEKIIFNLLISFMNEALIEQPQSSQVFKSITDKDVKIDLNAKPAIAEVLLPTTGEKKPETAFMLIDDGGRWKIDAKDMVKKFNMALEAYK